jgi:ABC-type multidrug transport system fused ATPase/permease subunit
MLQGINFTVQPGQKVALVGATGCGKSTCMSLLQRLYEPQQGMILIDDHPVRIVVGSICCN